MSVYEWVVQGAKDRLRAVVLTTLTTLAGVMPLAYGIGGTDFILQPMALSLGYGLLFGTLMTLILLPCLYLINHEFINWIKKLWGNATSLKSPAK
jgi:multidrug efflux pump subunit AcrB